MITTSKSPVIVIIRLMLSLFVWPKVITLSRFYCLLLNLDVKCCLNEPSEVAMQSERRDVQSRPLRDTTSTEKKEKLLRTI